MNEIKRGRYYSKIQDTLHHNFANESIQGEQQQFFRNRYKTISQPRNHQIVNKRMESPNNSFQQESSTMKTRSQMQQQQTEQKRMNIKRKQEYMQIAVENERLIRNIINVKSTINKQKLESDWWKRIQGYQQSMRKTHFRIIPQTTSHNQSLFVKSDQSIQRSIESGALTNQTINNWSLKSKNLNEKSNMSNIEHTNRSRSPANRTASQFRKIHIRQSLEQKEQSNIDEEEVGQSPEVKLEHNETSNAIKITIEV